MDKIEKIGWFVIFIALLSLLFRLFGYGFDIEIMKMALM